MYRYILLLFVSTLFVLIGGCAQHGDPEAIKEPYGFLVGIWHGIIFPVSALVNIISWAADLFGFSIFEDIYIIGRPNTGLTYYLGFFIGLGGTGSASRTQES